jgi:hypothetical protein
MVTIPDEQHLERTLVVTHGSRIRAHAQVRDDGKRENLLRAAPGYRRVMHRIRFMKRVEFWSWW